MRYRLACRAVALSIVLATVSCESTEWVHPTKPKDMYAQDYKACESRILNDPRTQQGNRYLLQQAIDRCLAKDGWMLREKR